MPMTMNGKPRGLYFCGKCELKFKTCGSPKECPRCHNIDLLIKLTETQFEAIKVI